MIPETLFDVTPEGFAVLDDVANDPGVLAHMDREDILAAIRAATSSSPFFHAGTMRDFLPATVAAPRVGAVVSALVKTGAIRKTGEYALSGNSKHRNAQRPVPWYRVVDLERGVK